MGRRTRFACWVLIVLVVVAAPIVASLAASPRLASLLAFTSGVALLGMLALLLTTPANAIRLPRGWSTIIIFAGFLASISIWARPPAQFWSYPTLAHLAIAAGVLYLMRRSFEPREASETTRLQRRLFGRGIRFDGSPWWSVPAAWHPVVVLLSAESPWVPPLGFAALLGLMIVVARLEQARARGPIGASRWCAAIAVFGAGAILAGLFAS